MPGSRPSPPATAEQPIRPEDYAAGRTLRTQRPTRVEPGAAKHGPDTCQPARRHGVGTRVRGRAGGSPSETRRRCCHPGTPTRSRSPAWARVAGPSLRPCARGLLALRTLSRNPPDGRQRPARRRPPRRSVLDVRVLVGSSGVRTGSSHARTARPIPDLAALFRPGCHGHANPSPSGTGVRTPRVECPRTQGPPGRFESTFPASGDPFRESRPTLQTRRIRPTDRNDS